jgi:uncharacterized membrane protein YgaE (UPF0421/DUF939 family)
VPRFRVPITSGTAELPQPHDSSISDRAANAVRAALLRLRAAAWSIGQRSLAAGAAWGLAGLIPGHSHPFFAPIAAMVALSGSVGRSARQAIEIVVGVAIGIGVADLIVRGIGAGIWQLALVVGLAAGAAVALDQSPLVVSQAAASAILIVALTAPQGLVPTRFVDALVGSGVALAFSRLIFPPDPDRLVAEGRGPVLEGLQETLDELARALADVDLERARLALRRAQAIDVQPLREALAGALETAQQAPARRRSLRRLERRVRAARELESAARDATVLATGCIRMIRSGEPLPPGLSEAVRRLARAVRGLAAEGAGPAEVRRPATAAVAHAAAALEGAEGLTARVVGQEIDSLAGDLLRASGLAAEEALELIRAARAAGARGSGTRAASGATPADS